MINFWLYAAALLLVALALFLIPVLRGHRTQAEEDRTALNVALYQERVAELQAQKEAGILTQAQFDAGQAEGARELLEDTQGASEQPKAQLGKWLPLVLAFSLPLAGLGLYLHWGASDKLELALSMQEAPKSFEDMLSRLEQTVKVQPDSAESWYFLGRAYMSQERTSEAANAFAKAVELAGRDPSLLALWAQAQYFANNKTWSPELQALADEVLAAEPGETTILGLLGIVSFEKEQYAQAVSYWERLVAALPEQDPTRAAIASGIQAARERGGLSAPAQTPTTQQVALKLRVSLAPELADKVLPSDSVFIFARAVSGPPMPLAAKRLTVADLPVEVTFTDADAMMPQLKLSSQPQVQLIARVSRDGNPTQGQWLATSQPVANDETELQQLMISEPEQR